MGKGRTNMKTSEELVARPESRLTPELVEKYWAEGAWRDVALGDYLAEATEAVPGMLAAISVDGQTGERIASISYADMTTMADRLAGGLSRLGVGAGDAVCLMLPNRLEFGALVYALMRLGAVYSGIPVSYGQKEAAFIVRRMRAKVLVVPSSFRGTNHLDMVREMRPETPALEHVVVLGGDVPDEPGWLSFAELAAAEPLEQPPEVDPGSLAHIGFTSGTTGEPKGVMNTHQTLDAVRRRWVEHVEEEALGTPAVNLIVSPVGHHTGFLWGALLSASVGGRAVYLDRWKPQVAAEVIRREEVTLMFGAPTFLQDLMRLPELEPGTFPSLHMICTPGAPIPRKLIPRARETLGCFICPAWGMTEWGIGISGSPRLPQDRVEATDGVPIEGCEVRVMETPDKQAEAEQEGELQIRGAGLFVGYYERPEYTEEEIVDGWFSTGDQATIHEDGFVSLLGRTKDIIIRGGENIPVYELENSLYRHPVVVDAAVIGVPDERLGERACAVLVVEQDEHLTLDDVKEFLLDEGISKHFLPERLELIDALPKTSTGKVRKVELRQRFAQRE
jgi:cyclohexanecarboxylate-CoA ligase